MQTRNQKCSVGLNSLQNRGLKPVVEENLRITFNDPVGLYSDLCKLQHRCALQGKFDPDQTFDQIIPTLYIDGKDMGPLDKLKVQEIKRLAEPSPFGLGSKTVYDENVRKAFEIKGDRIDLDMQCPYEIQRMAPMGHQIEARLYKLAIYDKDGFFAEHADTLHADNHLGTLVMCLPVPHEGGAFILSDDENELRLPFDELIQDGQIPWVAFYTDVKHKVEMVKSGLRMTLQFDLFATKSRNYDGTLRSKLSPDWARVEPENMYRFQDYNQEILSSIQNKLNTIFSEPKSQPVIMAEEEKDPNQGKTTSKPERSGSDNLTTSYRPSSKKFTNEEIEEVKDEEDIMFSQSRVRQTTPPRHNLPRSGVKQAIPSRSSQSRGKSGGRSITPPRQSSVKQAIPSRTNQPQGKVSDFSNSKQSISPRYNRPRSKSGGRTTSPKSYNLPQSGRKTTPSRQSGVKQAIPSRTNQPQGKVSDFSNSKQSISPRYNQSRSKSDRRSNTPTCDNQSQSKQCIQSKSRSSKSRGKEIEEEKDDENAILNPDGIAIMLKRRYGAMSLSLGMLKGSDGALYHALKDQFRVEVKQIILEQDEGQDGYGKTPNQIIALSEIRELPYSSEEEIELGQNNKHIPKKHPRKEQISKGKVGKPQVDDKENVKNVCLVTGFSSKYLLRLANLGYDEFTGNEALPAIYSYLHAALFVYPKEKIEERTEVLSNK